MPVTKIRALESLEGLGEIANPSACRPCKQPHRARHVKPSLHGYGYPATVVHEQQMRIDEQCVSSVLLCCSWCSSWAPEKLFPGLSSFGGVFRFLQ